MMQADKEIGTFFSGLRELDILIHVDDTGDLSVKAPKGALTPGILEQITSRKQELISYISEITRYHAVWEQIPRCAPAPSYPLSSSQTRLWVLDQVDKGTTAYNISNKITVSSSFDPALLESSIRTIVERHEILRTVFREDETGLARQWILNPADLSSSFRYLDLRQEPDRLQRMNELIGEEKNTAFDLGKYPLFRATLFQLQNEEYVLFYSMHHIISDGWSIELLGKEIMSVYDSYEHGRPVSLSPLRIQYKDYAVWQLEQLKTPLFNAHREYWTRQFRGEVPVLDLPTDRPRPRILTHHGHGLCTAITSHSTQRLRDLCAAHNTTLFMGLIAALNALLYRYTGQEDIVIGTPLAGRDHLDLEDQIGFYVNTLALRTRFSGQASFITLLQDVATTSSAAYEHQAYPFDRLVGELGPEGDRSRSPLFDIFVNLENLTGPSERDGLPRVLDEKVTDAGPCASKFDLVLNFSEQEGGLSLYAVYNNDIYTKPTIVRLLEHYQQMLAVAISQPHTAIANLEYLLPSEKKQLLEDYTDTQVDDGPERTIPEMLMDVMRDNPGRTALRYGNKKISFAELDSVSDRLAGYLRSDHGIGEGCIVGIRLERSEWAVLFIVAILKTGGAYVPIDPSYPEHRVDHIVKDSGCRLVIDDSFLQTIPYATFTTHPVTGQFPCRVSADRLFYVMYTSGSTGNPKGVQVTHGNVYSYVQHCLRTYFPIPGKYRIPFFTSLSFDLTVTSIFGALLSGSELIIYEHDREMHDILEDIFFGEAGIDFLKCTPSHIALMEGWEKRKTLVDQVVVGGEELRYDHLRLLQHCNPDIRVFNEYGPTEATVGCTIEQLQGVLPEDATGGVPIGKPIGNARIYILDKQRGLLPPGAAGELYIGGAGVAKGYLNRKDLTAERFVADPYRAGEVVYRTGDLGRWLPGGKIGYLGRLDSQVKIRGYRIEPGEIEHALCQLPDVHAAAVVDRISADGRKELVAYIVSSRGGDAEWAKERLTERLPDYMVPAHIVALDQIPLTVNGKVDKKRLPAPISGTADRKAVTGPRNEIEETLIRSMEQALKRPGISMGDNFLELGGDSIKAILVASRLKQMGYVVRVGDILKYPELEKLVLYITALSAPAVQETVQGEVALTPVQRWFLENDDIDKHHCNQSVLLYSNTALRIGILAPCLTALLQHHDALRMVFQLENGEWTQYNRGAEEPNLYTLTEYDLATDPQGKEMMGVICDEIQSSIRLHEGPLVKAGLFHLPDGDRFLLVIHHLVVDTVSWRILLEDLSVLYDRFSNGIKKELPLKSSSFRDWAQCLQQYAGGPQAGKELDYWAAVKDKAAGVPRLTKDGEGGFCTEDAMAATFSLNESQTEALLTRINQVYNTNTNDILLTGLGISTRFALSSPALLIELESHGREEIAADIHTDRTVGWFTSLYPIVIPSKDADQDTLEYLLNIKEHLRSIPNKGIGYGVLRHLRKDDPTGLKELRPPDISFNYLGDFGNGTIPMAGGTGFQYSGDYRGTEISRKRKVPYAVTVTALVIQGRLHVRINYGKGAFPKPVMDKWAEAYKSNLEDLILQLQSCEKGRVTPSDLSFKGLTLQELAILDKKGSVEDLYPMSPLQEGIYFHWLSEPGTTAYVEQMCYTVKGDPDITKLQKSFEYLVQRYPILRTSFHHLYGNSNLQAVHRTATPDLRYVRLSSPNNMEEEVRRYREDDRLEGFDLARPSQIRLTLLDKGERGSYEFIWSHHHILMDGWCMNILVNDFYATYQSLLQGREPVAGPVFPYADYIKWLSGIDRREDDRYWQQYLQGFRQLSPMPFANKNPNDRRKASMGEDRLRLTREKISRVRRLCIEAGVTENTFMQSAWGYLLSRYNRTRDVVFGAVVSGRPGELKGVDSMIGLFINTIPVRVVYTPQTTVRELLESRQRDAIEALPHHYGRLSDIQSKSHFRDGLFDHILVYENYPALERVVHPESRSNASGGFSVSSSGAVEETSYGLTILIDSDEDHLSVVFKFCLRTYSPEHIRQIKEHLETVIDAFVNGPADTLVSLDYMTPAERQQVLRTFNDTDSVYEGPGNLISLFRRQAAGKPQEISLLHKRASYTYHQLDRLSDQLAGYLQHHYGTEKEQLIGVMLGRSEWMIISLLAVLKLGCAYLPIDPSNPLERVHYILTDSGCRVCIDEALLDSFRGAGQIFPYQPVAEDIRGSGLAYVMYTSGSSGKPKGCMVEHRGLVNHMQWKWNAYGFSAADTVLQKTTFTFDVSVWEIFMPLCWGCKLVLCEDQDIYDPSRIVNLIYRHRITCVHFVPGLLKIFLDGIVSDPGAKQKLSTLRLVMASGEALPVHTVQSWYSLFNVPVHNLYGPTEASIEVSSYTTSPESDHVWIGKPISNVHLYILDEDKRPVAQHIPGELFIGGIQVARGYLNRPELSAEKFIEDAFGYGERLYRTGDLCRWLPDGNIEYLGRMDEQVKIRGYRIELGEIEQAICSLEGIEAAAVLIRNIPTESAELVAYTISKTPLSPSTLRHQLRQQLPEYMIPVRVISVEKFPLTTSGKVDKRALPDLLQKNTAGYVAPRGSIEEELVRIYEEMFDQEGIGIKDDFFDLGGNSIRAITLAARLQRSGYTFKIGDILKHSVIEDLARVLGDNAMTKTLHSIPADVEETTEGYHELAYNQLFYYTGKKFRHSFGTMLFHLADLEKDRFAQAYQDTITEMDILRLRFHRQGEEIFQTLSAPEKAADRIIFTNGNLSDTSSIRPEDWVKQLKEREFDLFGGEAIRCAIWMEASRATVLLLIHHAVTDQFSNKLIQERLIARYNGRPVPALRSAYREFISAQRRFLASLAGRQKLAYWTGRLGRPVLPDSNDGKGAASPERSLAAVSQFPIEGLQYERVMKFCKSQHVFPAVFMLYACCLLIRETYGDEQEFLVNMAVNGRDQEIPGFKVGDAPGQFSNTLPIRIEWDDCKVGEEIIHSIQERYLEARMNQEIPYVLIRRAFEEEHRFCLDEITRYSINFQEVTHESLPAGDAADHSSFLMEDPTLHFATSYERISLQCLQYRDGFLLRCVIRRPAGSSQEADHADRWQSLIGRIMEKPGNLH